MLMLTTEKSEYEPSVPPEVRAAAARMRSRRQRSRMVDAAMAGVGELGRQPDYIPVGYYITHVPDGVYPFWADQVDRIRATYDPGFIPIFRRMVFRTRAGVLLTFLHHGVARYDRDANSDPLILNARKPRGWKYGTANVVERWFGRLPRPGSVRAKHNLPHAFVPWGDWVERWVSETYWEATAAEKLMYVDEVGEAARAAKVRKEAEEEAAYSNREETPRRKRLFESLTTDDEKETLEKQSGRWRPDPKPFVDQGANTL